MEDLLASAVGKGLEYLGDLTAVGRTYFFGRLVEFAIALENSIEAAALERI